MSVLSATVWQMMVLFSLILMGYVVAKVKVVPENSATVLSKLENNLFVPALVLGTFVENFTVEKLSTAWKLFLVSFAICIVMMFLAIAVAKCCSKDQYIRNIYTYGLAFSNFGFMGNAVVSAVFPEIFLEYLIFTMPLWTMIYMWGVPCLLIPSEEGKQTIKTRLKSFANPMFAAMVIGVVIGLSGIQLPNFLSTAVNVTGSCMSPIAMMLTGITIANMDVKKVLSIKSIYVVSIIRLLVFPLIFIGVFKLVPMSQNIVVCTICSLAMPLGLSTLVIPGGYGKDTSVAAGMAVVSHLLSAITIPVIFYIMMSLL
ncbi:MAG: AEC family transporter [Tyzzerella sp.]|nr:AEC family transporter [Tyzzerella sp.]